jgi:hypothetical protein
VCSCDPDDEQPNQQRLTKVTDRQKDGAMRGKRCANGKDKKLIIPKTRCDAACP